MIAALLRLFALRPLLTIAILGFPLILLVVVGLFAILAFKFLVFVVLPVALVVWLARKLFRPRDGQAG
jgi:predicted lipid-binding transport protein (Tim44 family)